MSEAKKCWSMCSQTEGVTMHYTMQEDLQPVLGDLVTSSKAWVRESEV